jgi:hypothetical protein
MKLLELQNMFLGRGGEGGGGDGGCLILRDKTKQKIYDATQQETTRQDETHDMKHSTLQYLQDIESEELLLDSNFLRQIYSKSSS